MDNLALHHIRSTGTGCVLSALLAVALSGQPALLHAQKPAPHVAPLVVVCDDNYPPYVFREADGRLRGIVPEQWSLWQQKTGIRVDLRAMEWSAAQRVMRDGKADVIDTIFLTPERARLYAFTPAYAQIEVPVYVQKALGGIVDLASLKGFTIGVKTGDSVIDVLSQRGISNLKCYPSYESIILAAKSQEIRVFSVDDPAAVYFLAKHGISDQFRRSFLLYTGAFHRAVSRNRPDLLRLVEDGFKRISPSDYRAIDQRWLGDSPFLLREILRQWKPWVLGGIATVLALVFGNVLLGHRVRAQTSALRRALVDLRHSLDARERSQEELRISSQYLTSILNAMDEALFVHNVQTGAFVDVNRRMCEMFGFASREEALTSTTEALSAGTPPYTLADARAWMRRAITEGPQQFEWHSRHRDGHTFWVEIRMRQEKIGPYDRLIVTARDINERKQMEEYREMGQRVLAILGEPGPFEAAIDHAIAEMRLRSGLDAVGIRFQDGEDFPYCAHQGFSETFLQQENTLVCLDAGHRIERTPAGGAILACTCGLVLAGKTDPARPFFTRGGSFWTNDASSMPEWQPPGKARTESLPACIREGFASLALIPIRSSDRIIGLLHLGHRQANHFSAEHIELLEGIASHIGSAQMRRRAEEVLRENESKYRAIITASPVPMALNDEQQHITFLNPSFVQTFGYALEDLPSLDHWWPRAFPDATERQHVFDAWQSMLAQTSKAEAAGAPLEATVHCKDGSQKSVLISAASLPGPFSRTSVIVFFDITEHKRTEEQLQNVQKLKSVGTLAGGIAHDFNNILQALFGNISLAKDDLPASHPSRLFLDEAEKSLDRATSLTRQLLTFAKGGDPVMEDVSLGAIAEKVARFDLSGSTVSLHFTQAEDLWPVQADRGQIQQVISNLVINARQAMPSGGHLHLSLENTEVPLEHVAGLPSGRYVKVTVRDEGVGIDPLLRSRVFEPYFTTKPKGSGLGLTTAYSILSKHGGTIRVESELGKGSTFTLYLPACRQTQTPGVGGEHAESTRPTPRARILVMDDEPAIRQLVTHILAADRHAVETASNGQQALDLYARAVAEKQPFDLAILDLTVPGGTGGKDAIRQILAVDPHARAIVSSGYSDDPVMANPTRYGFQGAIAKPFTPEFLRKTVAQILLAERPGVSPASRS